MRSRWVRRTGISFLLLSMLAVANVNAQADRNCKDFANQAEAQASLNGTYPDDPNRLDADGDWIACEDFFGLSADEAARVIPANVVNGASRATPVPTPEPSPVRNPPAAVSPSPTPGSRIDPPADLMARVASCEVVAVSSRSIAAAGCPGAGTLILRPPAGTPRMRSQVIIRPGAALRPAGERVATAAQVAGHQAPATRHGHGQSERPRKKQHKTRQVSAPTP